MPKKDFASFLSNSTIKAIIIFTLLSLLQVDFYGASGSAIYIKLSDENC